MNFTSENSQNSAPGSMEAAKLGSARRGVDAQSVTKRYDISGLLSYHAPSRCFDMFSLPGCRQSLCSS
jgi:hypothetical protein